MYGGCGFFKGVYDPIRFAAHLEVWESDSPDVVSKALHSLPLLDVKAVACGISICMSMKFREEFWITLRLFEYRQNTFPRKVIQQHDALQVSYGIGVEDDLLHYNLCVINGQVD